MVTICKHANLKSTNLLLKLVQLKSCKVYETKSLQKPYWVMNSKSWICTSRLLAMLCFLQLLLCLGCSTLFRGGHNTRQETKSCHQLLQVFWSNENLPSFYSLGDSSKEKNYQPASEIMSPFLQSSQLPRRRRKILKPQFNPNLIGPDSFVTLGWLFCHIGLIRHELINNESGFFSLDKEVHHFP